MWIYEKRLQYPVKIDRPNPKLAKLIMSQFGGPDGELAASTRYLSQRYAMPYRAGIATLTDIGTEELAHFEIINALVHQLTHCQDENDLAAGKLAEYYVDHTAGQWPTSANGVPFTAAAFQSKGDPITDLHEDMAAEQKARTTYDNLIRMADDPDVKDVLRFLRQRELVHFQRFGETLRIVQDKLNKNNFYAYNPAFDKPRTRRVLNGNTGEYYDTCSCDRGAVYSRKVEVVQEPIRRCIDEMEDCVKRSCGAEYERSGRKYDDDCECSDKKCGEEYNRSGKYYEVEYDRSDKYCDEEYGRSGKNYGGEYYRRNRDYDDGNCCRGRDYDANTCHRQCDCECDGCEVGGD